MSEYIVEYGDSLWSIAQKKLGRAQDWPEIAKINQIQNPDMIYIGQKLELPMKVPFFSSALSTSEPFIHNFSDPALQIAEKKATQLPARVHVFFLAIESDPYTGKLVRKVVFPKGVADPELVAKIINPKEFGFFPKDANSNVSIGRHVAQNMTNSRFISASELKMGSPRFGGDSYWIDINKLKKAGAIIHDADAIEADLVRLSKKVKDPRLLEIIEYFKDVSRNIDKEVLIEGDVPPKAIKSALEMEKSAKFAKNLTGTLRVLQGFAIVITVYDLTEAGRESIEKKSIKPIATASTKAIGGWGGAWAGARLGGMAGAACGIETGPGAIVTGLIGSAVGGIAGYFGAEWLNKYVEKHYNEHQEVQFTHGTPQLAY